MCLVRVRAWVGDLVVVVCRMVASASCGAFGSVALLNPTLTLLLTLTTSAFKPQSKANLQDALEQCRISESPART